MNTKKIRFVTALTGLLALGFLVTSLASYWVAHDSLSDQLAESTLPLTSDNIYSEIQRDLLRPVFISSLMAQDTFLRDWAVQGETPEEEIVRYLAEIQQRYGTISSFFVSEKTRKYYHPTGILKTVSPDDPADAWYFRARGLAEEFEINVDWDTANRRSLVIFVNYQVFDYQDNLIGVTGVGLSMTAVTDMLENYRKRYGRDVFFVDRQGTLTLRGTIFSDAATLQELPGLGRIATAILTSPSGSHTVKHDGETTYVNSRLVPEFDWFLLVVQTGDPREDRLVQTLAINLVICLVISAVVLVLANLTIGGYQRRLERMASTDELTGAMNRQVFDMVFAHQAKLAVRRGTPLSLVLLDIDHFKAVNDTHGHQTGDRVLQMVVNMIRNQVRASDTLCRWGGEEFLLLLPDCHLDQAARLAEKIRVAVEAASVPLGPDRLRVTISQGVTSVVREDSQDDAVKRADEALYAAKANGRNRTEVAKPPGGAAPSPAAAEMSEETPA